MVNETTNGRKRIMLVVGEASGDLHGSRVVRALREREPGLQISAVAGAALRGEGVKVLFDVDRLTGMGFSELVGNLANLWRAYALLKRELNELRPDLLILIDFPEFNLRLAPIAKRLGIPVLYYISPQVWAWRKRRVAEIARSVDCMAVVFPFEVALYEKAGLRVEFVGHPLLEIARPTRSREVTLAALGLDPLKLTVAMLPGSRRREVAYHLPVMIEAAELLQREMAVQFVVVQASTVRDGGAAPWPPRSGLRLSISDGDVYNVLHACDLAWTASGTATLETGLMLRPMIIVYRLARLTYALARLLVRVEHVGMANILAGERVVPELIQTEMTARRIVDESRAILGRRGARERIVAKLAGVLEKLGHPGAAGRVADLALELIG